MKILLKILVAPFALALSLLAALLVFLFEICAVLLTIASVILAVLGVALFFTPTPIGGIVFLFLALYSIKIIYKIIIILYLVDVNGGFCMGSCTMITTRLQLYSRRSIIAMRRWSDEKDDLSRLGSHY